VLFTGFAECTIDAKMRLAIPAKHRAAWNEKRDGAGWYCVPWPGGVLRLFTESRFNQLAEQAPQTLTPEADEADLEASLYGLAERLEMDSAGRVTLPRSHIEFAGLTTDVVVVGVRTRLEVHDRAAWLREVPNRFARLPALVAQIESRRARRLP